VGVEEPLAGVGEAVEDDLVLAARAGQASGAQHPEVVSDEVLGLGGDPGEVADA